MRIAVVMNPAKVSDPLASRATLVAAFVDAGLPEPDWYETTVDDPGHGQAARAVAAGTEVIVAYGGDGTVRACVDEIAGTAVALAVVPAGTGNLLASNLGRPTDPADVVKTIAGNGRRSIDLGLVEGAHFAVMAGIGFDAAMMDATPEVWKRRLGWAAYAIGGARRLLDRPMRATVSLDGGEPLRRTARTILVGNVGRLQGGIDLFGNALPDDGRLDVAILAPRGLGGWLSLATRALLRRPPHPRLLETFRAETIDIRVDSVEPRELDGDTVAAGRRLRVRVVASALRVCVP
jgi:diacylglycerol kinase family enzyme